MLLPAWQTWALDDSLSLAEPVTCPQLIDVEKRIKAVDGGRGELRGCVELLARAESIRDIMAIEAEPAPRQAELSTRSLSSR